MGAPRTPFPPFLEDAIDHARRLTLLLDGLSPAPVKRTAAMWISGRVEEVRCVVEAVTYDWEVGAMSTSEAAQSLNAYLNTLHRGLAIYFGELAPACCVCALVVTATPASLVTVPRRELADVVATRQVQVPRMERERGPRSDRRRRMLVETVVPESE